MHSGSGDDKEVGGSNKSLAGKTYFVHFVDYLGSNSFRRIQDAVDIS
jgi:hypothetical protein